MHPNPFTLSLSSGIQVNPSENGYTLGLTASTGAGLIAAGLTVPALPGLENAIAHLREGTATLQQLTQTLSAREGAAVGEQLVATLQALGDRGWLQYGVLPLAIAEPMADSATLDLDIPHWSQANVSLSRFAYQRSHQGGMVLESPLSKFRIKLTDWRASALLAQLAQPQPLRRLTPPPQIGPETAYQFLNLLWATGFLSVEAEAPELQLWEFHNLLFHSRSRQGRHDYPTGDIAASVGVWDQFPVVKPPLGGAIVPLPQFSIDAIRQRDKTLTTALEKRQSMREYDDHRPITLEQLGEFLYRTARVKEVYSLEAEQQALIKAEFGEAFDWGEVSRRPYPCGGAMYELEIYPVVRHCPGVNPGLYHYDPLNHHLVQVEAAEADIQALLQDAHQSSGAQGVPQVLLIITARFGRLFRKYRSLAYALVLKHVGVLYENFYLVATAMDLAPCALGAGDSDRFAQATGLDYVVESSVGEFMLGSLPSAEVGASRSRIHTSESSVIRPHTLTPPGVQQSSGTNSSSPRIINHRYAITEPPLGERFATSVYKAIDLDNQNLEVAIKIYDHPVFREDILLRKINSEREALTKLHHPHIIKMLDCGIDEATGYSFFVLELMDSNLFDYLKEHEYKNWQSFFVTIALPVLEALAFCHNQQYLHRDLCSVNVLINQDGQVKLTDFGESRRVGQDPPGFSGLSHDVKSRYFQPPEADNDTLPYARDVYTFGVFLIECLKGKSFFTDAGLRSQQIGFSEVINTLPVPAEIQALIARTVAIDPAERPATAQVLLEQLQPLVQQLSLPSPPLSLALHPHDLDDRIPGLADLRNHTLGDPRITIVILDGNPDHSLSCFDGAEISKVFPYWHPPAEPVPQAAYLQFQAIDNDDSLDKEQKAEAQKAAFPEVILRRIHGDNHACHITSTIVGQENTPSPGLAPRCRVINVPLNTSGDNEEFISPLNLARAFELALDLGANIIHCAACRPTQTGEGEELLLQALRKCLDNNILIVAPAGNDEGECWCMPATLPGVLSVGALKPDGKPYKFSNWGGNNALEGIMAPGGEILGAQPANEAPVRLKGTSMAAPVVTGLCGLLMSRQLQQGKPLDAEAIRAALLTTALPCTPDDTDEPERCLRGKVNLPGAMEILFGPSVTISFTGDQVTRQDYGAIAPSVVSSQPSVGSSEAVENLAAPSSPPPVSPAPPLPITPSTITPSTAHSGHVYALGTIAYDFGDEARRDTFKQAMAAVNRDGVLLPPDPYDPRQMVDHLDHHPDQAPDLIWTLQLDGNTLYALDPKGPFAPATYEMFLLMLNGQLAPPTSGEFIDHISLPGKRTDRTVVLLSGEEVPVLKVLNPRGMYGWNVPTLVEAALATVTPPEGETTLLREGLTAFLQRVYHDLRNVGQTSRDRALNFAVTNTFQAAATFAEAIADRRQLDTIEVEKSPYCRMNSDCWDVLLTFYDPEDGKRSRQVFRFTLDVADTMPVTVGRIKRWAKPGKGGQAAVDH